MTKPPPTVPKKMSLRLKAIKLFYAKSGLLNPWTGSKKTRVKLIDRGEGTCIAHTFIWALR